MSLTIKFLKNDPTAIKTDILAILCKKAPGEEKKPAILFKNDGSTELDKKLGGLITTVLKDEFFTGDLGKAKVIQTRGKIAAKNIVLMGMGDQKEFEMDALRLIGAKLFEVANNLRALNLAGVLMPEKLESIPAEQRAQALVEGLILGSYAYNEYKDKKNIEAQYLKEIYFVYPKNPDPVKKSTLEGIQIAETVNYVRDLVNTPAEDMTPARLALEATHVAKKCGLKCTVLGEKEMAREKMNLILAVGRGAANPARFIHLQYRPKKKAKTAVAIIGKGITFDSGGYNLKPGIHINNMKSDMAGAAATLGVMRLLSVFKPAITVDAFIPATENMIDGRATKPGDVIRSRSGKTVEFLNMDAEGRLVLADSIDYAKGFKPNIIIDIATLTGHVLYGLGEIYTAILGNDQKLIDRLITASREGGEPTWQLPMVKDYIKGLKEGIADLNNDGKSKAGTIVGALFLAEFVGDIKWAHLDIATSSWNNNDWNYRPKGATGTGVQTLIRFLIK